MVTHAEIVDSLRAPTAEDLLAAARRVCRQYYGDRVILRSLIEFSNCCTRRCLYCGLRAPNRRLRRYRMTQDEIIQAILSAAARGFRSVVLQSGDDPHYSREMICQIVREAKRRVPELAVTLSVGERDEGDYAAFRAAGADRYLLKHETADPDLYRRLHPGQSWHRRIELIGTLRALGFQVGVGCIVGLPGQTVESLADEVLFLSDLQPDMIAIGPFLPQRDTPLADHPAGSMEMVLRLLAWARLACPRALIPATTALESLAPGHGWKAGLRAGANVIMVNGTPWRHARHYRLYDRRVRTETAAARNAVTEAGLSVTFERGDVVPAQTGFSRSAFEFLPANGPVR